MKNKKVVCIGHSTYDITIPVDAYPTENIKYRLSGHIECGGGPASNGAYLLVQTGCSYTMFAPDPETSLQPVFIPVFNQDEK